MNMTDSEMNSRSAIDLNKKSMSLTAAVWARFRRKRLGVLSLIIVVSLFTIGILAPVLSPYDYRETDLTSALLSPGSDGHLLGTDRLGRDLLTRTIYSIRTTVIITAVTVFTGGLLLGPVLGLLAGFFGRWTDVLISRIGEILSSLPALLMMILINATLDERLRVQIRNFEDWSGIDGLISTGAYSYFLVFGTLSLFFWVGSMRIVRAQVLSIRELDYITAAEALGATPVRILSRHIFPNVAFLIILGVSSALAGIAGSELVLTWVGVGVQPPMPSFGSLLFEGSGARTVRAYPHLLLVPGTIVTLLLFCFVLLGDAINDAYRGD